MILNKIDPKTTRIALHFLALPSVEVAINRVMVRVKQGGHDIPNEVIQRRFYRGLRNFFLKYQSMVDEWVLYNGHELDSIAAYSNDDGSSTIIDKELINLLKQYSVEHND